MFAEVIQQYKQRYTLIPVQESMILDKPIK